LTVSTLITEWVFQSPRLKNKPLSESPAGLNRVRAKCGVNFKLHDLRSFLTMGEKLDVPPLKRLVNHSLSNDMTGRYLILDIERLRSHMARITNAFLYLLDINSIDIRETKIIEKPAYEEIIQLRIPLNIVLIV